MASEGWTAVAIAVVGMVGAITAGWIGYRSGSENVAKDYVQLAVSTLDKKDASPELRRWSVDVLGKLSPVPFGSKLKEELSTGGFYRERLYMSRINVPANLAAPCPDVLKKPGSASPTGDLDRLAVEYETCRIKQDEIMKLIAQLNQVRDQFNAEQKQRDAEFDRSIANMGK